MTTSSPGRQRSTPSPTFQTMPEASEPPMWWSSSWERKTETGWPSAAQTLLKFTPAAITRTVTLNAPGSGTSISSSWKASSGSPWRSSRITQAAIEAGSSPGSTSSCATCFVSIATLSPDSGASMLIARALLERGACALEVLRGDHQADAAEGGVGEVDVDVRVGKLAGQL